MQSLYNDILKRPGVETVIERKDLGMARAYILRSLLLMVFAVLVLTFFIDPLIYRLSFPIHITLSSTTVSVLADGQTLTSPYSGSPQTLVIDARSSVLHEYQIDGTDSTNTATMDIPYLESISSWWYYRLNAWMRNLDGTSVWRDMTIRCPSIVPRSIPSPMFGEVIPLSAPPCTIDLALQMPETGAGLTLHSSNGDRVSFVLNRNDHRMSLIHNGVDVAHSYFPTNVAPFAARVLDFIARTLIWSLVVLFCCVVADSIFLLIMMTRPMHYVSSNFHQRWSILRRTLSFKNSNELWRRIMWMFTTLSGWRRLTAAIHPLALAAIGISFLFTLWIALFQYHALPHIYDANTYVFGAKMLLNGHISLPPSPIPDRFPGPFMVIHNGRWFTQYPPGTSLTLAIGLLINAPWLVEPMLGAASLAGIYLIAAQLYNRSIAVIAVLLGVLSPFYTYLAASYMSHTIALFYLVWGTWCSIQVLTKHSWRYAIGAGFMFGMAALVRDLIAFLFIAIILPGLVFIFWQRVRFHWRKLIVPLILLLLVGILFLLLTLAYNTFLTGSPLTTPRSLFFKGDHWGFGTGVGFYGQNTLAAGFVTVDELLTSLAIDLFGWPFYLTLAFLPMPFLLCRAKRADWLMAAGFVIMAGAFLGYYYHGIYLGPRYLYETLPFLLILTARGIVVASEWSVLKASHIFSIIHRVPIALLPQKSFSVGMIAIVFFAIGCNLLYYMPRQIMLHTNFTGMSVARVIDTAALRQIPAHHSLVVTNDAQLYSYTLFSLNAPSLHGDVVYALAATSQEILVLHLTYPTRPIYQLLIDAQGHIYFVELLAPSG